MSTADKISALEHHVLKLTEQFADWQEMNAAELFKKVKHQRAVIEMQKARLKSQRLEIERLKKSNASLKGHCNQYRRQLANMLREPIGINHE